MKKVTECIEHYYKEKNYNCAETIYAAAMEAWELPMPQDSVKLMAGFGHGLSCAITCGAICGGTAAMSCRYVEDSGHTSPALMRRVHRFVSLVRERMESTDCSELHDRYRTPEEHCFPTIKAIAEILDEVCEE